MTKIYNKVDLKERRRELRKKATTAEEVVWQELRNMQIAGHKFKRQYSVDSYVLDFYCPERKLAIELDGQYHLDSDQKEYDLERTEILNQCGIKVIRFRNKEVLNDLNTVLMEIKKNLTSSPTLLLGKEKGDKEKG
jgi:very-short-patch-repair endonuclease